MTGEEVRAARLKLRLSNRDFARMLDVDHSTVLKMQQSEDAKTFRKPAVRMVRLIEAYLKGFRPADWPKRGDLLPKMKEPAQ